MQPAYHRHDLFEIVQYWTAINSKLADYHGDLSITERFLLSGLLGREGK
jgi:hypothetical protein